MNVVHLAYLSWFGRRHVYCFFAELAWLEDGVFVFLSILGVDFPSTSFLLHP